MVIAEKVRTERNFQESGYNFVDLPIVALNHVKTDQDLVVTKVDYKGMLTDLATRKKLQPIQILQQAQSTAQSLSLFDEGELEELPLKIDQLNSIIDLTFYLNSERLFDEDGNINLVNPQNVVESIALKRGKTPDEVKRDLKNSRKFLSEFILHNSNL